jgi:IMP dehydrogenase
MSNIKEALTYDDVLLHPQQGVVNSRSDVDISIELGKWKLPTPFISSPMETVTGLGMAVAMARAGGLGVLHRFRDHVDADMRYLRAEDVDPIAIAIGFDDFKRAELDADILVLDMAHSDTKAGLDYVRVLKHVFPDKYLIVGSVSTNAAALRAFEAGADALRVGIGAGAACTTRIVTGFGVPMITSIQECAEVGIPVIADGGIKNSGDVAKALAAGATAVMIGRLFAGCDEAPRPGEYFGQASSAAHGTNGYVEGAVGQVESTGPVKKVIEELSAGLRSAISYGGGHNIERFQQRAQFMKVTPLSMLENGARI